MDKYQALERRLAELLGKEMLEIWLFNQTDGESDAYNWARNNDAAFSLMVKHKVRVENKHSHAAATLDFVPITQIERHSDHGNDEETAVRCAILRAVIAKLEA